MKTKISFEKNIALWLGLVALLLASLLGATFRSVRELVQANNWVAHTFQVLATLESSLSALQDVETGQRGYMLTGRERYLEPYNAALKVTNGRFALVRALTIDNPSQGRRLDALKPLVERKLKLTQKSVDLRRRKGFAATYSIVMADEGKRVMDEIRRGVADMEQAENALLVKRQAQSRARLQSAAFVGGLGALTIPILLLVVYRLIRRQMEQRNSVEAALREKQGFLDALLDSAGAGIVACDQNGVLTSMNRLTRQFHGLAEAPDALGNWIYHVDLFHADGHTPLQEEEVPLLRALRGEIVKDVEIMVAAGQNSPRTLLTNGQAILDANGQKLGAVLAMHDITARKQAEAELQKAHDELETRVAARTADLARANEELHRTSDRLQAIMDNTTSVIYLKDLQGRYMLFNTQFEKFFGVKREQIVGKSNHDLMPVALADALTANDEQVLHADGPLEFEEETLQPDGIHTYISIKFPLRDSEGRVYAMGGVSTDITERKRGEIALQIAKEEAERANRAKSELLSRTSHELRTPLNAIIGFSQLLEMDELEEEQEHCVRQIIKAGHHQLQLVDRILDLARIENGRLEVTLEAVSLGTALREALHLVRPSASERSVELRLDEGVSDRCVLAEPARLGQVLLNLLSNAIKYNHVGGSVTIASEEMENGRLRLSVRDTGNGLTPDESARLFRLFDRIGAEHAGIAGTGIGLTLSKGLIEAMGGTIGVQSEVGQGSTFWFELPLLPKSEVVSPAATEPLSEILPPQSPETHALMLYIEDNLSNLNLIQHLLRNRPEIKLLAAMQGGLGLELASKHQPNLILLDLHLPDINGAEVLRRLQSDAATRDIPVVILSADATLAQIERLRVAGARDHLTKPLDVKRFLQVVEENLGKE